MASVIVKGSLQSHVDDSSDDDDSVDNTYHPPSKVVYGSDDDEEEIERFQVPNSSQVTSEIKKPPESVNSIPPKKLSLIEAMEASVKSVESNTVGQVQIHAEEPFQSVPLNAKPFSTQSDSSTADNGAPDVFGIAYKPFKKPTNTNYPTVAFDSDPEVKQSLSQLKSSSKSTNNKNDDDEFDFDGDSHEPSDSLQQALQRAAINASVLITEETANDPNSPRHNDEESIQEIPELVDVRADAQNAFNELKSIYGSGLGDIEVRLLDTNQQNLLEKKSNSATKSGGLSSIRKTVNVNEAIEEGDEDAELEEEVREVEEIKQTLTAQQQLENEWNSLDSNPITYKVSESNETTMTTYNEILKYFESSDLSEFKSLIVTREDQSSTSSWISGPTKLKYPNCDEQLEFPFLIAQVNYDASIPQHFGCLRRIFLTLTKATSCSSHGPHWERIGFQGVDPVTDLNRSMKMFAVLQVLHLLDYEPEYCRDLHKLSGSDTLDGPNASGRRSTHEDKSWPFMCVSVMFTREAIQSLRRGELNKKCNKRQDVMSVLHDFHHACFYDFAKRLIASPNKHHAEVLKDLRDYCQTNPSQLIRNYRNAIKSKSSLPANASIINLSMNESSQVSSRRPSAESRAQSTSKPEREVVGFDTLDEVEEASSNQDGGKGDGFWSSIGLGGRANRFKT